MKLSHMYFLHNVNGTDHEAVSFIISIPESGSHQCSHYLYNYKRGDFYCLKSVLSYIPSLVYD